MSLIMFSFRDIGIYMIFYSERQTNSIIITEYKFFLNWTYKQNVLFSVGSILVSYTRGLFGGYDIPLSRVVPYNYNMN